MTGTERPWVAVRPVCEPDWEDAACREVGGELFHPEKGDSGTQAKRICRLCAIKVECLEYALEINDMFGVYGGTSGGERKKIKRERKEALSPEKLAG